MDSTAPITADAAAGRELEYARRPAGRSRRGLYWAAGIVVVLVLGSTVALNSAAVKSRVFGAAALGPSLYTVEPTNLSIVLKEDGELKPKKSVDIKCELEGQTTILWVVEESTRVNKGDLIVELASDAIKERLDTEEIQLRQIESSYAAAEQDLSITRNENASKIKKCQIDYEIAQLEYERYTKGDYQRDLQTAEINIKQSEMEVERKQDELDKNQKLFDRGFVNLSKIEQLEFELEKAKMTLNKNELAKEILLAYEKPKNDKEKQSNMEQAGQELEREQQRAASREQQAVAKVEEQKALLEMRRNRVQRLRDQYGKCKIYAPMDGIVQYPSGDGGWRNETRIAAGEKVYEGQTILKLPDTDTMLVNARVHEADRHRVKEGMPCLIKVPAVPDRTFSGRVASIAKFADTANRWLNPDLKEHTTEIILDQTDAPLSPGDSAEIQILIEEVDSVLAVPIQCVFVRGAKSYVFVQRGGSTDYVEVEAGRSSSSKIEIVNGLSAGDRVLMHVAEELTAMLPPAASPVIKPPAVAEANQPVEEAKPAIEHAERGEAKRPRGPGGGQNRGARRGGGA